MNPNRREELILEAEIIEIRRRFVRNQAWKLVKSIQEVDRIDQLEDADEDLQELWDHFIGYGWENLTKKKMIRRIRTEIRRLDRTADLMKEKYDEIDGKLCFDR